MAETVRFAPSPTGFLHLGNVRTALYNAFLALRSGGAFVLRYDDTDAERSEQRFAEAIADDLGWLGVEPARVERQSERLASYDAAAETLREAGLLYPAYDTPQELERKRSVRRARGLPPIYDRAALELSDADRAALEGEGRRPHWRFKLPAGQRTWDDLCRGPQAVNLETLSDPILIREDGSYLYTLPSVVDDADFAITTVVRGEDHVTNSGVQIALFEALGAAPPRFAHHNLLVRADGEPLSKRENPLSIGALREAGYEPMAVASLATLVGTSHSVEPIGDLASLAATISLADVSRGPATFEPGELDRLNAALVHELSAEAVAPLLDELGVDDRFWSAVRGNLRLRGEARDWAERLADDGVAIGLPKDAAVLSAALGSLPADFDDEAMFKSWTAAIREATGARGRQLFMPLRRALTGIDSGPEMGPLIALLGPDRTRKRLVLALEQAERGAA